MIELLIATAILLAVMALTLTSLNQAFRANEAVTMLADLEQNLRAGMNYMIRDLIQSGDGIPTGGIPIPYGPGLKAINRPSPLGAQNTFPATYTTIPAVTPGPAMGPGILEPSDMITILYADNTYPLQQYPIVNSSNPQCTGKISVQSSILTITFDATCANLSKESIALRAGDLIMLSNAQGYALQTVTGVSNAANTLTFAPGDAFNLNGNDNPGGNPQGTLGTIESPQFSGSFPPTTATRVWMVTYFLNDTTDPKRPMLMRQVNLNPPQPVAEVIEDLQISYDVVDGALNPTNVKQPVAPDTPTQIRKVNLYLAGRSEYPFTQSGTYFRNNLITQVSLRSLAFVSQYQ